MHGADSATANNLFAFGAIAFFRSYLSCMIGNGVSPVGKGKYGFNGTSLHAMHNEGESPNRDDDTTSKTMISL